MFIKTYEFPTYLRFCTTQKFQSSAITLEGSWYDSRKSTEVFGAGSMNCGCSRDSVLHRIVSVVDFKGNWTQKLQISLYNLLEHSMILLQKLNLMKLSTQVFEFPCALFDPESKFDSNKTINGNIWIFHYKLFYVAVILT